MTTEKIMPSRKFEYSYKVDAVKLSYEKDSLKEFGAELGIAPNLLTRWRKEYQKFGSGSFQGIGYPRVHPDEKDNFEMKKSLEEINQKIEILREASPYINKERAVIYQFIKDNEKKYSTSQMCRVLQINNGTYIRWKKRAVSEKKQQTALLKKDLLFLFNYYKKQYGRNKLADEIRTLGYEISARQVSFYMKQLGLYRVLKRKFKATTDSVHGYYTPPNILNRNFKAVAHSEKWVSDISYIQTTKNFLYLTIIIDLYDRKVIGWNLSSEISALKTTIPAWEDTVKNREVKDGLIFHSDRGIQYANKIFTARLNSCNCVRSMSRKGNFYDNAVAESFFSTLKKELIYKTKIPSARQAKIIIYDFIENWYNKNRIHSSLNYKTIDQFNAVIEISDSLHPKQ